jgi:steroid delta-isomerase-like uncharacterized protein
VTTEANKKAARDFINEILNKGNLENVNRIVTTDFAFHSVEEDLLGIEKFKTCVASDQVTFHNIKYTVIDCIAERDKVAAIWVIEATHEKEYRGIPATHKKFETMGVSIFHFQGDKIKEAWAVADGLTAALQLGVVRTEYE